MKNDFLGRELALGDFVGFVDKHYKELRLGKVLAFTPQKVKVGYGREFERMLTTDAHRMCRIPPEEVMIYLIKL